MSPATPDARTPLLDAQRARLVAERRSLLARHAKIDAHLHHADRELPDDWSERASVVENDEVLEALDGHARQELARIDAALGRMDAGTWGDCAVCGEEIAAARLAAMPMATRCISCAS